MMYKLGMELAPLACVGTCVQTPSILLLRTRWGAPRRAQCSLIQRTAPGAGLALRVCTHCTGLHLRNSITHMQVVWRVYCMNINMATANQLVVQMHICIDADCRSHGTGRGIRVKQCTNEAVSSHTQLGSSSTHTCICGRCSTPDVHHSSASSVRQHRSLAPHRTAASHSLSTQ